MAERSVPSTVLSPWSLSPCNVREPDSTSNMPDSLSIVTLCPLALRVTVALTGNGPECRDPPNGASGSSGICPRAGKDIGATLGNVGPELVVVGAVCDFDWCSRLRRSSGRRTGRPEKLQRDNERYAYSAGPSELGSTIPSGRTRTTEMGMKQLLWRHFTLHGYGCCDTNVASVSASALQKRYLVLVHTNARTHPHNVR